MSTTISDSVAIAILTSDTVLIGVGNELHLFTGHNGQSQTVPFELRGAVHGIEVVNNESKGRILVHGGKEFMILDFCYQQVKFNLVTRGIISDWISSARILSPISEFVFITAHSVAINLLIDNIRKSCGILKRSQCEDKSTLYCSFILGSKWENLTVFGGNAFGELLVWKPFIEEETKNVLLLHRIASHNGVIFSIDVDIAFGMVTTTSDDRSIQFWKLQNLQNHAWNSYVYWKDIQFLPFASGYGHKARVFQGKLIVEGQDIFAITAGEDSYICLWRSNGELIFKRRQQFGAAIWKLKYDQHTRTVFTIGSTGNLLQYNLDEVFHNKKHEKIKIFPKSRILNSHQYLVKIKFITNTVLVGLTNENRMITIKLNSNNAHNWKYINEFKGNKCTILKVHQNTIVLAGYKRITIFEYVETEYAFKKVFDGDVLQGVVRSFHFLTGYEYLICDNLGNCICVLNKDMTSIKTITLPKFKEPWITAAIKVDNFYVLSNRHGNIFLYSSVEDGNLQLTSTLKRVHGNLGVTSFCIEQNELNVAIVKSAGHDGIIRRLGLDKNTSSLRILSIEQVPIMWVENLLKFSNVEYILGFIDNHFGVWSREQDFAFEIKCGGGHRCWDFNVLEKDCNKEITVIFIKHKELLIYNKYLFNQSKFIIQYKNNWHVKSCNILQIIENCSSKLLAVSGSDDNLVKISSYCRCSKKVIQLAELHSHISNIRTLKVKKLDKTHYIIFSAGGRAQLCVTIFDIDKFVIEERLNLMLKSLESTTAKPQEVCLQSETRIMSLDVKKEESREFILFLGCSDGYLRKFNLEYNMKISLISQVSYGKCVLHVRIVCSKYILCTTTDGIVRFLSENLDKNFLEVRHHESGANSLDISYDNSNYLHLITGGDDQSVIYSKIFCLTTKDLFKVVFTKRFYIHSAQVTALKLSSCAKYFYSTGIDQNLLKTDICNGKSTEILHTPIADIKGMCITKNQDICFIYGCGLQVYPIKQ